jgi:Ca2+:H+ antiporter
MFRRLWIPISLLAIFPVAPCLYYLTGVSPLWVFLTGAVAIGVLADWIRRATEQIADQLGPAIGGLLSISFGSLAELILAVFVLASGKSDVVRAQMTGSIIGTSLFGLGLAIIVGSIGREKQTFQRERAGQLSSLLILVVIALLLPAVFDYADRSAATKPLRALTNEDLSIGVSIVLLALYGANLVYTLVTHRDVFAADEPRGKPGRSWSILVALAVLVAATAGVSIEANLVSDSLGAASEKLGLSSLFLGVVVLGLVGTASDIFAAAWFARQGKMGLAINICVGSAIQIALVVAPVLVLVSWFIGQHFTLVFGSPLELFAIAGTVFIVNAVADDGETTWFEGVLLVGVYVLFGLAFLFAAVPG